MERSLPLRRMEDVAPKEEIDGSQMSFQRSLIGACRPPPGGNDATGDNINVNRGTMLSRNCSKVRSSVSTMTLCRRCRIARNVCRLRRASPPARHRCHQGNQNGIPDELPNDMANNECRTTWTAAGHPLRSFIRATLNARHLSALRH